MGTLQLEKRKGRNDNWGKKGPQHRGGQKSEGTGRLAAITVTKIGIL